MYKLHWMPRALANLLYYFCYKGWAIVLSYSQWHPISWDNVLQ